MSQGQTIKGLNDFLAYQKSQQLTNVRLMIIKFNTAVKLMLDMVDINQVPAITSRDYQPSGCTALYDAIIQGVDIAHKKKSPNDHLICVIMTDGMDNSSRHTREDVARLIQNSGKDRTFVYIGEQPETWVTMGIKANLSVKFEDPAVNFSKMNHFVNMLREKLRQFGMDLLDEMIKDWTS